MQDLIAYIICFIIAFLIPTIQYGQDKFQQEFWILFYGSVSFYIYGLLHALLAILTFYFLLPTQLLNISSPLKEYILAFAIGFCLKGFLDISFIDIPASENKEKYSIGPKLIVDFVEKIFQPRINNEYDICMIKMIQKELNKALSSINLINLVEGLKQHMPIKSTNAQRISFQIDATSQNDKEQAIRLCINQFGFRLYKLYLKSLHK